MKKILLAAASALALSATGALAETIIRDGCEWKKAENGNYYTRVDAGCKIGKNGGGAGAKSKLPPVDPGDDEDPTDPTEPTDPGEGGVDPTDPGDDGEGGTEPGDDQGGSDEGEQEGGDKPTKPGHGHGDDNHDHSGPPGKGPKG